MTSADPDAASKPMGDGSPPRSRKVLLFAVVAVLVYVLDVVSKSIVVARLEHETPVRLLGGAVYLVLTRNSGAAFSVGTGATVVLTVVAVVVVVVILRAARRLYSASWAVALGLVLGGAVGNLTDRVLRSPGGGRGHVVDWISLFAKRRAHLADLQPGRLGHRVRGDPGRDHGPARHRSRRQEARRGHVVSPTRLLPVPEGLVGVRLDVAVARLFGLSRTAAAALIDSGDVLVDGGLPPRSARLADGSLLEVRLPDAVRDPMPPQVVDGLAVLYDDADVVVVDKPAGVAAHPSPGWTGPTVVSGLSAMGYQVATSGAAERQGIVHRLDVGTTGVMAVAKSERAYSVLKRAFKTRAVEKRYAALAQGHPDPTSGTIDAPIGRHPSADYKFAVVAGGRPSITHYATEEAFRAATLLDIQPGNRKDAPDPGSSGGHQASVCGRPHVRRGSGAGGSARPVPARAARSRVGLRPPDIGGVDGYQRALPTGLAARARSAATGR